MKIKKEKIQSLILELDEIIHSLKEEEDAYEQDLKTVCKAYRKSAKNLIHYQALRRFDHRAIQKKLGDLGLSRFARAEGHILTSLINIRYTLQCMMGKNFEKQPKSGLSIKRAGKLLTNHSKEVLGCKTKGRRVSIMVTLPSEAADSYRMVYNMVKDGMNSARINCAHDGPEAWGKMIKNIKKASKSLGRNIKIIMDLAGPKIRTGAIAAGARVRKFSPKRNEMGKTIKPAQITLVPEFALSLQADQIPVDPDWLNRLKLGDIINFKDTRNKDRVWKVVDRKPDQVVVHCADTSYVSTGTPLSVRNQQHHTMVGQLPTIERSILLHTNDLIIIHKDHLLGEPAAFDKRGLQIEKPHISCQMPEVFRAVKEGETILFDDGKIAGIIVQVTDDFFEVRITRAKALGTRLKAEKGMNFPDTDFCIKGLTAKDKTDLRFIAEHADAVNLSFANSKDDVENLLQELEKLDVLGHLNIMLKIETRRAFDNMTEILLAAMKTKYIGVMIARGDLAVETGWENIGWVQKEILSMSNAAHVPVVWATQVLESLAKKGLPSRSEITDVVTSLKAECVMLNKGPHIHQAIVLLNTILTNTGQHQEKNEAMLPKMGRFAVG